jgi:FKBP-type peptidyl-prolyl cis-trans isomerase FklB
VKLLIALSGIIFFANTLYAGDIELKNQRDKVSYGIGMDIGNGLKSQSIDIDPDILARGLKDVLTGGKLLMTEEEFRETMTSFRNEMVAKQMARAKELSEKNKKEGEEFLTENKTKEGVVTLPSGLQYKIIKDGDGEKPKATDMVTVNYRGTLIDGTEFDSSTRHGQAATFKVDGVIPGWTEALQLMKTGSKWQIFIPSNLAYGERGAGRGEIGPNATLIFEVELLSIQDTAKAAAPEGKAK